MTDQRIRDQQITSVPEALNYTTGVSFDQGETERGTVYSRGASINNHTVDGVTAIEQSEYGGNQASLAIHDRVEVVRGATGLTKSSGEPSAAVNLVRKRATAREVTGQVQTSLGSWSTLGTQVDLSAPLSADGRIRSRFIVHLVDGNSYLDRYHRTTQTYLVTAEADLTERTTLIGGVEHRSHNPTGTTWGNWPLVFSDGSATDLPRGSSPGLDWTEWNSDVATGYLRLEHAFDSGWTADGALSRSLGHYDSKLFYTYGLPDPVGGIGISPYAGKFQRTQQMTTAAIDLAGPVNLFERNHQFSFGLSAERSEWHGNNSFASALPPMGSIFDWDGSYPEPPGAKPAASWPSRSIRTPPMARRAFRCRTG